ncbi:hypothetical protein CW708_01220 [Candidatus Bathyarchaeota archaeon]|nr:MAG: hypothetical protein CW708_01220 [Candidatus Bathyarchaeota archaeon]
MKGIFRKDPPPLQEVITKSIQKLKVQHYKLEQVSFRLKTRDRKLFQTCVHALKNNRKDKATICANELAEVRKLLKFLYHVELSIERVILRLETVKELSDIIIDLKPALQILKKVSKQLSEFLPDVSTELSKVNDTISETLYSARLTTDESVIPVDKTTPEGEQILKEVSNFLEEKIAEKLPEPPATIKEEEPQREAPVKQLVALATACSQTVGQETVRNEEKTSQSLFSYRNAEIQEVSLKVEKSSLEDAVLEYVKKSNGEIDLMRCSVELKTSPEDVKKALKKLGDEGKIKIEAKTR